MINSISASMLAETQIREITGKIEKERAVLAEEYRDLPEGKLYIRYRGDLVLFTERRRDKLFGITRNRDLVHALARREYLELQIELLDWILEGSRTQSAGKRITRLYQEVESLLKKYEEAGLDMDAVTMTPAQRIWNANRHSQKEGRREDLQYPTDGEVYVRTKSEQVIGNLLEELHIPYHYETRLVIGSRAYHPDFLIMLPNDRLVILEHAGRMDLREYNEGLIVRLQAYDSVGLMIGRNVFLTFEHDTKDKRRLKSIMLRVITAEPEANRVLESAAKKAGCRAGSRPGD